MPTLIVFEVLSRQGAELGLSRYSLEKIERVKATGAEAVRLAAEAGVRIGSGSDLLGHTMARKAEELVLKAQILGPMQAIVSATNVNAELFGLADRIGVVAEGKQADLIVVDGDPLADIAALADAERISLVVKGGAVIKRVELPSERPRP